MTTGQYFVLPIVAMLSVVCAFLWLRDLRQRPEQPEVKPEYPLPSWRLSKYRFYDQDKEGW